MDHEPEYEHGKHLPYPSNSTLYMSWDLALEAVTALIQLESQYATLVMEGKTSGYR